jgi:integrase
VRQRLPGWTPLQSDGAVAVPERWDRERTDPSVVLVVPRYSDLHLVQRALGHRHVTTTEIYARVSDEALRRAVVRP